MAKREIIKQKYNSLCAYTGKVLDDKWQIDHIHPKCRTIQSYDNITHYDDDTNLVPAISIINHYKRSQNLEEFREYMKSFHIRLKKLPKITKSLKTIKRKKYMEEIAMLFDITIDKPFNGIFYFETL